MKQRQSKSTVPSAHKGQSFTCWDVEMDDGEMDGRIEGREGCPYFCLKAIHLSSDVQTDYHSCYLIRFYFTGGTLGECN